MGESSLQVLLAPATNLGLIEIELEAETRDDRTDQFSAGFSISSAFNPSSTLIPYNRASGITSAIVFPSSGKGEIFSGLGSAFKTHGGLIQSRLQLILQWLCKWVVTEILEHQIF